TAEEKLHLLMQHRMFLHQADEFFSLRGRRQLAYQQQMAGFHEIAAGSKLLDRVTAIQEFTLVAVDIGDSGIAGCGRHETRVISQLAAVSVEFANVDGFRTERALVDGQLHRWRTVRKR